MDFDALDACDGVCPLLGIGEGLSRSGFELGASRFELRHIVLGRWDRFALWNQKIPTVTGLHVYLIAQRSEVADIFQQNDFHRSLSFYGQARLSTLNQEGGLRPIPRSTATASEHENP